MDLFLDGNGSLYRQLVRALKTSMATGRLPKGTRLPASRDLAVSLGLSRATVVAAYEQLRTEGLITGRVGAGSFVSAPSTATLPVRPTLPRTTVDPQSAFSRRARQVHDHGNIPGKRRPGAVLDFQYGFATVNPSLARQWAREIARAAHDLPLSYPPSQGMPALRQAIATHIGRTRGVVCEADDVLVVGGVQQAMALVSRVLLDPGDAVVMEEPAYFGARRVLQMHGANLRCVPVDQDGLCVSRLPAETAKLVCVTPSHQFPTGAVMSLPRRQALIDYAERHQSWICEDDYDGEFRQEEGALLSLQSLDRSGRVVYVGSFSKTLFPAARLGYVVMPRALREDFIAAKWATDAGCPPMEQLALASFIAQGGYDRHLRQITRRLSERRKLLQDTLAAELGDQVEVLRARTGMHLMVWLRGLDLAQGEALVTQGLRAGLGLHTVAPCYVDPPDRAGFLLGFGTLSPRELVDATRRFAMLVRSSPAGTGRRRGGLVLAHSA
jgi:GntR family transcriptional regulator/MocR family aminotransferase